MTVGTLKSLCAAFYRPDDGDPGAPADFIINGVDILLAAINNARRSAARAYNFKYLETTATLSIASTGTALPDTTKTVGSVALPIANSDYLPIEFLDNDEFTNRIRMQGGRQPYVSTNTAAQYGITPENPLAYQRGNKVFLYPPSAFTFPVAAQVEIVSFPTDYTADGDTDFFTVFGPDFLQWQASLEINKWAKQWVSRTEGNVDEAAITEMADRAWAMFIQWDQQIGGGTSNAPIPPRPGTGK